MADGDIFADAAVLVVSENMNGVSRLNCCAYECHRPAEKTHPPVVAALAQAELKYDCTSEYFSIAVPHRRLHLAAEPPIVCPPRWLGSMPCVIKDTLVFFCT